MRKYGLIVFLIIYTGMINAQDYHKIDSLKIILNSNPYYNGTEADTLRMKTCFNLGKLFLNSMPDTARYWFALAIDTSIDFKNIPPAPGQSIKNAECFRFIGITYYYQGDYPKTIYYLEKSLQIFLMLNNAIGASKCYNNLGVVYDVRGDYPKAIDYYEKSLKTETELENKEGIASCYMNMGIVFLNQGDYPKTIAYLEKSLTIKKELSDKSGIARCMINLGTSYEQIKDFTKAINYYKSAILLFEEINEKMEISEALLGLGIIYKEQGDYQQSKEYLEKALKLNEDRGDILGISFCLYHFGKLYYEQGEYYKALEFFKKSIKIKEEQGIYVDLAEEDYPGLASAYAKLFEYDKAAFYFLKAVEIERKIIQDNFSIMSEKEKGDFLEKSGKIYNILNDFASVANTDSVLMHCYNNEMLLKGLLLNNTSCLLAEINNSKDASLTNAYWKLVQLRNNISQLQSTPINQREENLDSLENLANEQERKLVILSSDFAGLQKQFEYKWQDVQKNLKPNDIAIEFIRINYLIKRPNGNNSDSIGYAALILRNDYQSPKIVKLCSEASLLKMVGDLSWNEKTVCKMIYSIDSKKGLRLYNFLWKPIEPYLDGVDNIYYAPIGILNQISFAAIPNYNHQLLSDQFKLNMVSSTRSLIDMNKKCKIKFEDADIYGGIIYDADSLFIQSIAQNNKKNVTLLREEFTKADSAKINSKQWNYLSGTAIEGEKIEKLLIQKKIKTRYYDGYDGLEEKFKFKVSSPSIIHIATHGFCFPTPDKGMEYTLYENSFIHNTNPLFRSGLLFAGANRIWSGASPIEGIEDGVLTAYEVSNLNLRQTKLVVLSACETGLGDLKGNEGVYGLQRAFKMAGVKYIIMSLWQVPDAQTAELMEYFYKELLSCNDVRKAFGIAQDKMKLKYEPYYWAGFVLIE